MRTTMMKKGISVALIVALTFVMTVVILPGMAYASTYDVDVHPASEAVTINVGDEVRVGGTQNLPNSDPASVLHSVNKYYKFDVTKTSIVTIDLSTEADRPGYANNTMRLPFLAENATTEIKPIGKSNYIQISGSDPSLTVRGQYKVVPGTYYLNPYFQGTQNANAWIKLTSIEPVTDDINGEPNDSVIQANGRTAVKAGVTYTGNIRYNGKDMGSNYGADIYDYYRFVVPSNGYTVKLSFTRADTGAANCMRVSLIDKDGYYAAGGDYIDMNNVASGSYTYKNLAKGTYYVWINASGSCCKETEYTFKLTQIGGVKATSVKLSKSSATVTVGKTLTLKPTISPAGANKTVTWSSSKKSVATVNSNGVVKGVSAGKAYITVKTASGKTAKCLVTVK